MTTRDVSVALSYQSPKYPLAVAFDNGELGQEIKLKNLVTHAPYGEIYRACG